MAEPLSEDQELVAKARAVCRCAQAVWAEARREGLYLPFDLAVTIARLDDAQGELLQLVGYE